VEAKWRWAGSGGARDSNHNLDEETGMNIERRTFLKEAAGVVAGIAAAGAALAQDKAKDWKPLFNGKDLTGWKPEGGAVWAVEKDCLVGKQGPKFAPGDLFTTDEFGDFELEVVYKAVWPANSGIWFRYQAPDKSYQADILEYKDPVAYSGTIYCPGKLFLTKNLDPKLEKKEDWNTMNVKAQGDHLVVSLNGKVTGDTHENSFAKGKIGFQVHPGEEFKDMKIIVKSIKLRAL